LIHPLILGADDPLLIWLTKGGAVGILAAAVVAFLRGWVVSGTEYKRVCDERDKALELVYRNAGVAQRAVDASLARLETEAQLLALAKQTAEAPAQEHRPTAE
jgi:hypothetical protein